MATLEIENLSDQVLDLLRRDAQQQAKQISEVAAERLASSYGFVVKSNRKTLDDLMRIVSETHGGSGNPWLTPEFIRAAREDGRE